MRSNIKRALWATGLGFLAIVGGPYAIGRYVMPPGYKASQHAEKLQDAEIMSQYVAAAEKEPRPPEEPGTTIHLESNGPASFGGIPDHVPCEKEAKALGFALTPGFLCRPEALRGTQTPRVPTADVGRGRTLLGVRPASLLGAVFVEPRKEQLRRRSACTGFAAAGKM